MYPYSLHRARAVICTRTPSSPSPSVALALALASRRRSRSVHSPRAYKKLASPMKNEFSRANRPMRDRDRSCSASHARARVRRTLARRGYARERIYSIVSSRCRDGDRACGEAEARNSRSASGGAIAIAIAIVDSSSREAREAGVASRRARCGRWRSRSSRRARCADERVGVGG